MSAGNLALAMVSFAKTFSSQPLKKCPRKLIDKDTKCVDGQCTMKRILDMAASKSFNDTFAYGKMIDKII